MILPGDQGSGMVGISAVSLGASLPDPGDRSHHLSQLLKPSISQNPPLSSGSPPPSELRKGLPWLLWQIRPDTSKRDGFSLYLKPQTDEKALKTQPIVNIYIFGCREKAHLEGNRRIQGKKGGEKKRKKI